MTITTAHIDQAKSATRIALAEVSQEIRDGVDAWLKRNSGFSSLTDMVASGIAHHYSPTIRPVNKTKQARIAAERVASAFDAAMSWAFEAGEGPRAFWGRAY